MITNINLFAINLIKGIGKVAISRLLNLCDNIDSIRNLSNDELDLEAKSNMNIKSNEENSNKNSCFYRVIKI